MRYEVTTKLSPQEALQRAVAHFGPQGAGLNIVDQHEACLVLEGGGGHVTVTACPGETARDHTILKLETREWDYAVRQFMTRMH